MRMKPLGYVATEQRGSNSIKYGKWIYIIRTSAIPFAESRKEYTGYTFSASQV